MGLLEGYFVPLYNFYLTPDSFEQKVSVKLIIHSAAMTIIVPSKWYFEEEGNLIYLCITQVHNVAFAFELMQDGGLKKPKARPEGTE